MVEQGWVDEKRRRRRGEVEGEGKREEGARGGEEEGMGGEKSSVIENVFLTPVRATRNTAGERGALFVFVLCRLNSTRVVLCLFYG